jgi:molybdenum cofactor cytidylyltransferase
VFHRKLFPDLLQLKGNSGAKKLILEWQQEMTAVPFPMGSVDIDTPADYSTLKKNKE